MLKVEFTDDDILRIIELKNHHRTAQIRKRMLVLWLKHLRIPHKEIRRIANVSKSSVVRYLRAFQEGGPDALLSWDFKGRTGKLDEYASKILEDFKERPPCGLEEAARRIKDSTGVDISLTQVSAFFSRNGVRRLKTGNAPGKIDPARQEEFKKKASNLYSWRQNAD